MTDLLKFVELYKCFGIELEAEMDDGVYKIILENYPNGDGYYGFYSKVSFDRNGKFISQGFWE